MPGSLTEQRELAALLRDGLCRQRWAEDWAAGSGVFLLRHVSAVNRGSRADCRTRTVFGVRCNTAIKGVVDADMLADTA
jgi:hypothetical protein